LYQAKIPVRVSARVRKAAAVRGLVGGFGDGVAGPAAAQQSPIGP
jgi:hypothetical protein